VLLPFTLVIRIVCSVIASPFVRGLSPLT